MRADRPLTPFGEGGASTGDRGAFGRGGASRGDAPSFCE